MDSAYRLLVQFFSSQSSWVLKKNNNVVGSLSFARKIRPYTDMVKHRSRVVISCWYAVVGAVLAGSNIGIYPLFPTLLGSLAIYLVGLFAYVYNDASDIDADRINAANRPLPSGRASKAQAMKLAVTSAALGLILSLLLNPLVLATALSGIFLGYIYSTPRFSLKNHPLSKVIVCCLWAGIACLGGSLAVSPVITGKILYALGLFMLQGLAFSPMGDLMDIAGDRAAGKRTIAVVLGPSLTAKMIAGLTASALVCTTLVYNILGFNWLFPVLLGVLSAMLIRGVLLLSRRLDDKAYRAMMAKRLGILVLGFNSSLLVGIL